jgi:hypothetical protein
MSRDEVIATAGHPKVIKKDRHGDLVLDYHLKLRVTIAPEGVVEVGILPEIPTDICGVDVFSDPGAFSKLCALDGDPREILGFIVLLNLGITMTGFHDGDEGQKAVTVFTRDRWNKFKPDMNPFSAWGDRASKIEQPSDVDL